MLIEAQLGWIWTSNMALKQQHQKNEMATSNWITAVINCWTATGKSKKRTVNFIFRKFNSNLGALNIVLILKKIKYSKHHQCGLVVWMSLKSGCTTLSSHSGHSSSCIRASSSDLASLLLNIIQTVKSQSSNLCNGSDEIVTTMCEKLRKWWHDKVWNSDGDIHTPPPL